MRLTTSNTRSLNFFTHVQAPPRASTRVPRISTGTGDDGTTGSVGGSRVPKASRRVETTGAIDETNDALGLAAALATREELKAALRALQADLFAVGADVAAPPGVQTVRVTAEHVARVEREEDRLEGALPPLRHFVLPGGTPCAAALQLARSLARRADREAWRLRAASPVHEHARVYLN